MIVCCGEALIDMVRMPFFGKKEGFLPVPGGSPYNTAIAIARMGVPVKFLGKFSTDTFGQTLVKRLKDNKVGSDLIIRGTENSPLALVTLGKKGKDPQYSFYTEGTANCSLKIADLPPSLPNDTRCILFGSISMTVEPMASSIEALLLREGSRKSTNQMDGAPILSFDPNIRPFTIKDKAAYISRFEKWIAASTIAKISAVDFAYLYPELSAEKALQKILAMGPRLAICTLGTKGALALLRQNNGSIMRVSAPVVNLPVIDTIGAGDAFHGALLSWLEIKGKMSRSALVNLSESELYDALFFANKAASLVCSRQGAEPPTRKEVVALKLPVPEPKKAAAKAAPKAAGKKPALAKTAAKPVAKALAKPAAKAKGKKPAVVKASTVAKTSAKPAAAKAGGKKPVSVRAAAKPAKKALPKAAVKPGKRK